MIQQQLLVNNSLFEQVFEHAPVGMALLDLDGRLILSNPSFNKLLGFSSTELMMRTFQEITYPDDLNQDKEYIHKLVKGEIDTFQIEKQFIHKCGNTIWCYLNVSLLQDSNSNPQYFIFQIHDITDRKIGETRLHRSEECLKQAQRMAQVGSWEYCLESERVYLSDEMYSILGLNQKETILYLEDLLKYIHQEDRLMFDKMIVATQLTNNQGFECRIIREDGQVRTVYICLEIKENDQNQHLKFVGMVQDVTDKKLENEELLLHGMLYKLISENARDIISYATPDGVTRYVSPVIRTLLGYEPDEVIGKRSIDFYHPEDQIQIANMNLLNYSDDYTFTCRVLHKQGYYLWFETTVKAIRNEAGEIEKILGVGRDITERKKTEKELRKTQQRLESFVQNNADAIWVIDTSDHVLEINTAFENMFGWKTKEIIGEKLPIIPDFLKDVMQELHEKVKSGESCIGFETIRQRKDGVYLHVSASISPIYDLHGKIVGLSGVCRDISKRVRTEKALMETKEQLESFIDNHVDGVAIFNKDGNIVRTNKTYEVMFGLSEFELIGVNLNHLENIPNEFKEDAEKNQMLLRFGVPIQGYETTRIKRDDTTIDVSISAFPIFDSNHEPNGWAVAIRDITDWKKAQQLIQNSEKLSVAGQLAAGIAHEIRNPITAISGFMQLMKSGYGEKQEYFSIMETEIARIEMILNELLILAKPQITKFVNQDVHIILEQVTVLLNTQAILKNIEIIVESSLGCFFHCDENQIKQVFINFIKNAIEAMPKGGRLTIQVNQKVEKGIVICFIDEGCGIPAHNLTKMGQPFYTTKENGTGLGFMISKKIIENHKGDIRITSEINKGTTLEIHFPILQN